MIAAEQRRMMKKPNVLLLSIAVGALALAIGIALAVRHYTPASAPVSAAQLFAHTFNDADGTPQSMSQWRGHLLVVNFWATWCAPCVEEMPDLQAVQRDYSAKGVTVVGLAIDNAGAVKQFRDQLQLKLPLLIAGAQGGEIGRQLGNTSGALPYTVLVDRKGEVVRAKLGRVRVAELRGWLDEQLALKSG